MTNELSCNVIQTNSKKTEKETERDKLFYQYFGSKRFSYMFLDDAC